MPKTQPMFEIKGFRGKNNLADSARILPSGGATFLAECRDEDIDDEFMIHRRGGFGSPIFAGGDIHSLWSNGDMCLFVQGLDLKRLNPDYTAATVISGVGIPERPFLLTRPIIRPFHIRLRKSTRPELRGSAFPALQFYGHRGWGYAWAVTKGNSKI